MQEHRQAEDRVRRRGLHSADGVFPAVPAVPRTVLLQPGQRSELGPELIEHVWVLPQDVANVRPDKQPAQLRADALRSHPPQHGPMVMDGPSSLLFDVMARHGGKPQRPHDPQPVLLEAQVGPAYAADRAVPDVLRSAERVMQGAVQPHGDGVHGEVPAGQVHRQIGDETHMVRAAAVGVRALCAIRGDLIGAAVCQHRDGAVLQPGLHEPLSGETRLRLLREGRGTDVPVVRRDATQQIPYAAAHQICLMARAGQRLEDMLCPERDIGPHLGPRA